MAENQVVSRVSAPPRPTITLPPRSSIENIFSSFAASGVSPGPLSLVSSFFSDYSPGIDTRSFSQLLAGAMASPAAIGSLGVHCLVACDRNEEPSKEAVDLGFKQNRPMNLAVARSPLFTIPPGLSPSGFLNSPGQAIVIVEIGLYRSLLHFYLPLYYDWDLFAMSHQQALAQVTAQAALSQSFMHIPSVYQPSSLAAPTEPLDDHSSFTNNQTTDKQMPLVRHDPRNVNNEPSEVSNSDNKPQTSSLTVDKPVDDGYNWRKYGQKQVKGGEYPRSYYKCTHQLCPVKKKVERSLQGQITEITYKGKHNHELPPPSKRPKDVTDVNANVTSQAKLKVSTLVDAASLDKSDVTAIAQPSGMKEQASSQATSAYSRSSENEERVDDETRNNAGDDGNEPNPKRRNIEVGTSKLAPSHKTVTDQKIVVQTRSEVDLLDDGFRWRKYGQKVVKGSPHPRSYYKCTTAGCNVRKHVERDSTDAKAVITTYEGKHTHDLPTARTNSHNKSNINPHQLKPHEVVPESHKSLEVIEFVSKQSNPQPILQLKEEQIRA